MNRPVQWPCALALAVGILAVAAPRAHGQYLSSVWYHYRITPQGSYYQYRTLTMPAPSYFWYRYRTTYSGPVYPSMPAVSPAVAPVNGLADGANLRLGDPEAAPLPPFDKEQLEPAKASTQPKPVKPKRTAGPARLQPSASATTASPPAKGGRMNLLKTGGRLDWPEALRSPDWREEREEFETLTAAAVQQAAHGPISRKDREELLGAKKRLRWHLKDISTRLDSASYQKALRFLDALEAALEALP